MIYQGYTNMYHYIFSFFPEKAYEYIRNKNNKTTKTQISKSLLIINEKQKSNTTPNNNKTSQNKNNTQEYMLS